MGVGNWKPLFFPIIALFVVGITLNLIVGSFIDLNNVQPSGIVGVAYTIVQNGTDINFPFPLNVIAGFNSINFNFLDMFGTGAGNSFKSFIANEILIVSVIPDFILLPAIFLFLTAIIWGIIKIALP